MATAKKLTPVRSIAARLAWLELEADPEKLKRSDWASLSSLTNDVANFIEALEIPPKNDAPALAAVAAEQRNAAEALYRRILEAKKRQRAEGVE